MGNNNERRSIRLQGYDYASEGAYYLTICTDQRRHWFGKVVDGTMHRSPFGELAQQCWDAIPGHMPHVDIGQFIVMPNHVHGMIIIRERVGARHDAPGTNADDAPGTNADDAPGTNADDAPGTNADDTPGTNADDAPGTNAVDTPATNANDAPGTNVDDAPGTNVDDAPGTNADDAPGTNADDAPGTNADDAPGTNAPVHNARARHDVPLRDTRKPPGIPSGALGQIVASYKSAVTRIAYQTDLVPRGTKIWQRNYWENIIRSDHDHDRIAQYIAENPANWPNDRFR